MITTTIKMLLARRLRLAASTLAVLAGVAFVAGTLVLTDTIAATLHDAFAGMNAGTDVVVRDRPAGQEFGDQRGPIDAALVATVAAVDGVEAAEGRIQAPVQLLNPHGRPVGTSSPIAATLGGNWVAVDRLNPFRLAAGRPPRADEEVVIDRGSAKQTGYRVGDTVTVLVQAKPTRVRVVGIATFGAADSPAGGSYVGFARAASQRLLGRPGKVYAIAAAATAGVSQQELRDRIARVTPATVEVVTGAAITTEERRQVKQLTGFVNRFLLAFALIALFVGSFIIYNTFSILVAQRSRELALLRALGASRRQVLTLVLGEAAATGLVAALLGLAAGIGVAAGLKALLAAFGLDVPAAGLVVTPRTVLVSLLVGLLVSLAAAVLPARRAARVAPLAALRELAHDAAGHSRRLLVLGAAVTALGAGALLGGLASGSEAALPVVGLGGALLFLGVTVIGPVLARPVTRLVGAPLAALAGMPGRLARANALRSPKRTSATAAALMIGVGLVGFATIVAASSKASTAAYLDRVFTADFVVESGSFGPGGLSPDLAGRLERLPEVKAAAGVRQGLAVVDGARADLMAVDPASYAKVVDLGVTSGRLQDLDADGIAVLDTVATAKGWSVGDRVPVRFPETGQQRLTVAAIYHTSVGGVGSYLVGLPVYQANFARQVDARVFIDRADTVTAADARAAIHRVLADYPTATLQDQTEFKQAQATQIDQVLNFVYLLLALAVVIALLGIANTLALSILERTRELGLLRAVGMTRRQLRATVRYEAVIIALFGTVLGLLIAVFFGWAMVTAVAEEQVRLAMPAPQLAVITLAATLAGVLAAVLPARRASRLDVLAAIATE